MVGHERVVVEKCKELNKKIVLETAGHSAVVFSDSIMLWCVGSIGYTN